MATGAAIAAGAGAASAAVGVAQMGKASDAMSDAAGYINQAFADALAANEEVIQYWQEALDEWEEIYGPIEQNIADYYTSLDPERFAAEYKTNLADYTQKYLKQFDETLAQTGVATSGMRMQAQKEAAFKQAEAGATVDMKAPEMVAQQQQAYLNPYLQQKFRQEGNLANAMNTNVNLMQNQGLAQSGMAQQQANLYGQSAQGWMNMGGSLLGMAGGLYGMGSNVGKMTPATSLGNLPKIPGT